MDYVKFRLIDQLITNFSDYKYLQVNSKLNNKITIYIHIFIELSKIISVFQS